MRWTTLTLYKILHMPWQSHIVAYAPLCPCHILLPVQAVNAPHYINKKLHFLVMFSDKRKKKYMHPLPLILCRMSVGVH